MSRQELNARANRLAHHLRGRNVGRDTLVVIAMQRSFEMVIAMLAILKAGGAYVPVDPTYPPDLVKYMFEDAGAKFVVTQDSFAASLPATGALTLALPRDEPSWASAPIENPARINEPGDAVYCIYTSGSTGRPKGAVNVHSGICNRLHWIQSVLPLQETDRVAQKTPFTFDVSVWEFFWPLVTGATLVITRPEGHRDPLYLQELILAEKITTIHFVPAMLNAFLDFPGAERCSTIRQVFCSGEALPAEVQRRLFKTWPQSSLHNLYGPTEAAVEVTWWPCSREDTRPFVPIGRPIANTQIRILDTGMRTTGVNEPGELHIGGVNLARGYHQRPELTLERFVPDPDDPSARLYKTGDLARWLEDGSVQYLGRIDHQVKIGGVRIELEEVSSVLLESPEVIGAVAVAADDNAGQTRLLAFVVLREGTSVSAGQLKALAARKMPAFQVPSVIFFLPKLPLNANGKIDRKALPIHAALELLASPQTAEPAPGSAPTTVLQLKLKTIWQEALARPSIGVDENFFEIGGASLLAVKMFAAIDRVLNFRAPLSMLISAPTIRKLAEALSSAGALPRPEPCVLIQPLGSKTPLFITHGIGGNVLNFYSVAQFFAPDRPVYGIQSPGVTPDANPPESMEAMAAQYIREVRKVQPEGPYHLAGWSFGGVVVFEMAHQLLAAGESVGALVVLDSAIQNSDLDLTAAQRLARRVGWVQRKVVRDLAHFSQLGGAKKLSHVRDKAEQVSQRMSGWVRSTVTDRFRDGTQAREELMRQGHVRDYYGLLVKSYMPKPLDLPLAFVQASGMVTYLDEPIELWRRLSLRGVTHIKMDADHGAILYAPAVADLAAHLKELLERAEAHSGGLPA